jgi:hypothetical protein
MRRAAALALRLPWLLGLLAGAIFALVKWAWAAAADGAERAESWRWSPLIGAVLVVVVGMVLWLIF